LNIGSRAGRARSIESLAASGIYPRGVEGPTVSVVFQTPPYFAGSLVAVPEDEGVVVGGLVVEVETGAVAVGVVEADGWTVDAPGVGVLPLQDTSKRMNIKITVNPMYSLAVIFNHLLYSKILFI